jgi:type II secretion system protein N
MPDKKSLIRWLSFTAYFVAAFLVFLLLLFPFDRVRTRLESEVRLYTPFELSISRISPRFFNHFVFSDVVVSDKGGKVLFESPTIRTTVSLFNFLRRRLSLNMKSKTYGGELLVKTQLGQARQYLLFDASGLDIGSYAYLKDRGFKLGTLGGNFEMTGDSGKGRLWIKGWPPGTQDQGFSIPDLDFEQCWLEAEIKGDRLTIKTGVRGQGTEGQVSGRPDPARAWNDQPDREAQTVGAAGEGTGGDHFSFKEQRCGGILPVQSRRYAVRASAEAVALHVIKI